MDAILKTHQVRRALFVALVVALGEASGDQSSMKSLLGALEALDAARQNQVRSERLISTLQPSEPFHVADIVWCGDNNTLVSSGGGDKSVLLWDAQAGKVLRILDRTGGSRAIACSRNARFVASGGYNKVSQTALRVWDITKTGSVHDITGPFPPENGRTMGAVSALFFTPNSRFLVARWQRLLARSGNAVEQHLVVYRTDTWAVINDVPLSQTIPAWMPIRPALSERGHLFAYTHGLLGGAIYIEVIDTLTGQRKTQFHDNNLIPSALAFGRDDETLLIGGRLLQGKHIVGNILAEYSITEKKHLRSITTGHIDSIVAIVYRRDASLIITAGLDKTVELRNALSGKLIETIGDKKNLIYSIGVRPDGQQLVSAGRVINIWPLNKQ